MAPLANRGWLRVKRCARTFFLELTPPPRAHVRLVFTRIMLHTQHQEGRHRLRGAALDWPHLLVSMTGTAEQALLLRHASLGTAKRMRRRQITDPVRLCDGEHHTLAEIDWKRGKQARKDGTTRVKPDTILGWHRTRMAQTCARSPPCQAPGRPPSVPSWTRC
jgi:hypothetical protein